MVNESAPIRRLSPIVFLVIIILLALSVISLYLAVEIYIQGGGNDLTFYLGIGMLGILVSVYMFLQSRRRVRTLLPDFPKVSTLLVCSNCNFKSVREFKRGDYIFKESDECPKCKEKMIITEIYRETEEKEKKFKTIF